MPPLGAWYTAELSAARSNLAATSVGDLAIFAGGVTSTLLRERDIVNAGVV